MKRRAATLSLGAGILGAGLAGSEHSVASQPSLSALGLSEVIAQSGGADYLGLNIGTELNWLSWRDQLIPLYQQAKVRWLRVWYNWSSIESSPGVFKAEAGSALQLAKDKGFRVAFVVWGTPAHAGSGKVESAPNLDALSRYCTWLKTNWGDRVDAWEIGNEPNLAKYFSGSAADYVAGLSAAYAVLKGSGLVIAAGPSGSSTPRYWDSLFAAGMEQVCDRVNIHPYRKKPKEVLKIVDDFRTRIRKPLWITELGASSNDGGEEAKATFTRELLPQLVSRVETLCWYRSIQGEGLHPLRFGLIKADRTTRKVTPLPAYTAFANYAQQQSTL